LIRAIPFFDPGAEDLRFLPECPRVLQNYPGGQSVLGWVAIQHGPDSTSGSIHVLDLETRRDIRHDLPGRPGFFVETAAPGVVLIGLERRLILYDLVRRVVEETGIEVTTEPRVIINDGIAISGGLIFGTKDLAFKQEIAAAYHFDGRSRRLRELKRGQICSNGKYFFYEGAQAFLADIDSPRKTVVLYELDLNSSTADEGRIIADFRSQPAFPDGMRVTPDGRSLMVAFYDPGSPACGVARQVSLLTGTIEEEWELPGSPRVTCPEFVRVGGRVMLLFTTAVEGMPPNLRQHAPHAGCFFLATTDFSALPSAPPLLDW
jgi:sugar lactone lactonase YvrE